MSKKGFGVIILLAVLVITLFWTFTQFQLDLEIDSCLDKGGSWDYDVQICQHIDEVVVLNDKKKKIVAKQKDIIEQVMIPGSIECVDIDFVSLQEQADSLVYFMTMSLESKHSLFWKEKFFCAFPSTFQEMKNLFAYHNRSEGPLYSGHGRERYNKDGIFSDVIACFTELRSSIPTIDFYNKYIKININGRWDADNIREAFMISNEVINNTDEFVKVLQAYSDDDIKSVFTFIFDGPHPQHSYNERKYEEMMVELEGLDKRITILLKVAYDELMKKDHSH